MAYLFGTGGGEIVSSLGIASGSQQDQLYGLAGDDTLLSGANDDILVGGDGNDALYGGQGNDDLDGGLGNDSLLDGTGNDTSYGGDGDDVFYVGQGNDLLVGGNGIDTLSFFLLDHDGTDAEFNSDGVVFDLARTGTMDLGVYGIDRIYGFENVQGSFGNDTLFGSVGVNQINGLEGNDVLFGRGGGDNLLGWTGADVLTGGTGNDLIETYFGALFDAFRDRIDYNAINESGITVATRDTIQGFDKGGTATDDKIDLSTIDANPLLAGNQKFVFRSAFTTKVGEVKVTISGADTLVSVDTDADKGAEMTILVQGVTGLNALDFIL